jgi:hypothetical protein
MSNKPLAIIEIPNGMHPGEVGADLVAKYPQIEFQLSVGERSQPAIVHFDRRGADFGSIDGDKDKPFAAISAGILTHLFQLPRGK